MSTKIEWTDETWNPIVGCNKISPGCDHCYAEIMARRLAGMPQQSPKYSMVIHEGKWSGNTFMDETGLKKPFSWKKPRRIFVVSMGDLFHESVSFSWILEVMYMINKCPQHIFQILTKRPERMHEFFTDWIPNPFSLQGGDLSNLHLGVTAENQEQANKRIPALLDIPAAKRFVSIEPMLGPVNISKYLKVVNESGFQDYGGPFAGRDKLDQVIVGGETGPGARPMHPNWVTNIRDQCVEANVPFFFKSWGEYIPSYSAGMNSEKLDQWMQKFGDAWVRRSHRFEDGIVSVKVGRKASGQLIEGKEWKGIP